MVFDDSRSVCEIGAHASEDVDADGRIEIPKMDPVYDSEANSVDGTEEGECHYCPRRYEIGAFEFTGSGVIAVPRFNGGEPFVTPRKHSPGLGESAVSELLLELIALVRGPVQTD